MVNRNKAAGTEWETAICRYLRDFWPDIDRRVLAGRFDKGDIINGPAGWTLEAKTAKAITLPLFLRQAKAEALNNGTPYYAVIVKNRKGPLSSGRTADAFFVMPLSQAAQLLADWEDCS